MITTPFSIGWASIREACLAVIPFASEWFRWRTEVQPGFDGLLEFRWGICWEGVRGGGKKLIRCSEQSEALQALPSGAC